jgi:hypothetical protein
MSDEARAVRRRHPRVPPTRVRSGFVLRATGEEAVRQLQEALREGKEIEIQEGVDVTFTRLPPAMEDMVGERLSGAVKLGPAERALG